MLQKIAYKIDELQSFLRDKEKSINALIETMNFTCFHNSGDNPLPPFFKGEL